MDKFRLIIVAAGALALGTFAGATAQAAVQGGAGAIRAASENGAVAEQVQFRFGGYDYCWADDGWRGPGWYWCGYAYRPGLAAAGAEGLAGTTGGGSSAIATISAASAASFAFATATIGFATATTGGVSRR